MEECLCVKCLRETCPNAGYNTSIAKCTVYIPPKPITLEDLKTEADKLGYRLVPKDESWRKTNADCIRAKSDDELARWLALHPCLPNCPAQTDECFKSSKLENCKKQWLNWLREEAE